MGSSFGADETVDVDAKECEKRILLVGLAAPSPPIGVLLEGGANRPRLLPRDPKFGFFSTGDILGENLLTEAQML